MKKLFSLSLLLSLVTVVMAEGITKEQALDRARQFMAKRNAAFSQARGASGNAVNYSVSSLYDGKMYVVNAEGNGFVLVSGDDTADLILGYADSGTFTLDNAPENIRYWMECYAQQMEAVAQGKGKVRSASVNTIKDAISPLISTTWGQGSNQEPTYNSQCIIPLYGGTERYCVTGCYATAMAQIVNYHQFPTSVTATGFESYSYIVNEYQTTVPALTGTTFDWSNMPQSFSTASEAGKTAVATLMRYCGQAVKMAYSTGASSALSTYQYPSFVTSFGYDESMRMAHRNYYSCLEWEDLIYGEMKARRPVLYSGQSSGGGHSFVVDGYDGAEHYHVNWGWDGVDDGYFLLSLMDPYTNTGTGASATEDGYSMDQSALVGIKPATKTLDSEAYSMEIGKLSADNSGNVSLTIFKESGVTGVVTIGFAVVDGDGNIDYVGEASSGDDFRVELGLGKTMYLGDILSGKLDGVYTITGAYKEKGVWKLANANDYHYIVATISGSQISYSVHPNANVSIASVELTGTEVAGSSQEVKVKFVNNSTDDYVETVWMLYNGAIVSSSGVYVPAGNSAYAYFYFTPISTGTYSMQFGKKTSEHTYSIIGSTHDLVISGTAPSEVYVSAMSVDNVISQGGVNYLCGNTVKASIMLSNPTNNDINYGDGVISYEVQDSHSTKTVSLRPFTFRANSIFPFGGQSFVVDGSATIEVKDKSTNPATSLYTMTLTPIGDKLIVRDASGSSSVIEKTATVPATATSVDLRHLGTSLSEVALTPSANPNCLYYLASGATAPACLSGKNVVIGSTAASLALQSGYDFRPLEDFTATSATYTTSFTNGTDGTGSGWYSLCLPFSATSVSCGSQEKHWFNTSHSSADFWIYDFVSDNSTSVTFAKLEGSDVPANHPCIIAVPGNHWGAQYDLTNKAIVFSSGSSVQIKADAAGAATGSYYKLVGGYTSNDVTDAYLLNAAGNSFLKTASGTSPQFGAYFVGVGTSTSDVLDIIVDNKETTAIGTISAPSLTTDKVFNVMGQQVSPNAKGIKIIKGRKFIK